MENNLPKGWIEIELQQLVSYRKGKKPKTLSPVEFKNSVPYLNIKAVEKNIVDEYADSESSNISNGDEIFVVWDGARSGWVAQGMKGAIGSTLTTLKPYLLNTDYLFRFLQTQFDNINSNPRGTGIPHVDPELFWNIKVPLAPLAEQHRIVAKLDALLARVANCKNRLEKIPVLLKNFRQTVLAAAVSGDLTKEWREHNRISQSAIDFIKKIQTTNKSVDFVEEDLPNDWVSVQVGDVFEIVRGSSPRPKKDPRYFAKAKTEFHWIMLSDFTDNSKNNILFDTNEYLTKDGTKFSRYVNQKDILVGVSGVYGVGRTCLLDIEGYIYDGIMAIKNVDDVNFRNFINFFMQLQRMKFMDSATGTSWPNINTDVLRQYVIPIPPPEEQKEIVRKVEELFHFADSIEARYQKAKAWFAKLPQSILAKAFRGELVEQDENDEPATVLLERIKKEKQNTNKPKPIAKRKKVYEENEGVSLAAEE